jgi:hypothetical protein
MGPYNSTKKKSKGPSKEAKLKVGDSPTDVEMNPSTSTSSSSGKISLTFGSSERGGPRGHGLMGTESIDELMSISLSLNKDTTMRLREQHIP